MARSDGHPVVCVCVCVLGGGGGGYITPGNQRAGEIEGLCYTMIGGNASILWRK